MLRSKLVESESDIERMKRQLTNERFERERTAQELRKIHDNSLNESGSRYASRCHSPIRTQCAAVSLPLPLSCNGSGGAAAAVAAAQAAVAASNHVA